MLPEARMALPRVCRHNARGGGGDAAAAAAARMSGGGSVDAAASAAINRNSPLTAHIYALHFGC
jgi:hypothetical protein